MQSCILLFVLSVLPGDQLVLSTDTVAAALQSGPSALIVLDVRATEAYLESHLPGAANVPLKSLSEKRDGVANMLKPVEALKAAFIAAGVDPAKKIVLYGSGKDMDDMKAVGRMFWILEYLGYQKVTMMNGGLVDWNLNVLPLASGASTLTPLKESDWTISLQTERCATKAVVQAWMTQKKGLLVDARSEEYFQGTKLKEGVVTKKGHLPGATNAPAGMGLITVLDETEKPVRVLIPGREELIDRLWDTTQSNKVITYCNSGNAAAVGYLLYRVAGVDNIAMYDGSMAEWTQDDALSVANPAKEADPEGSGTK